MKLELSEASEIGNRIFKLSYNFDDRGTRAWSSKVSNQSWDFGEMMYMFLHDYLMRK